MFGRVRQADVGMASEVGDDVVHLGDELGRRLVKALAHLMHRGFVGAHASDKI